jgi:hypothetical protein
MPEAFNNNDGLRDIAQAMGLPAEYDIPARTWCAILEALTEAELRGYRRGLDRGIEIGEGRICK